jgi:hypothetical protein
VFKGSGSHFSLWEAEAAKEATWGRTGPCTTAVTLMAVRRPMTLGGVVTHAHRETPKATAHPPGMPGRGSELLMEETLPAQKDKKRQ